MGDERVHSLRDHGIGQVRAEALKGPDEQPGANHEQTRTHPPQPGWIRQVGEHAEPEQEADGAKRREKKEAFLPPIEVFLRGPGAKSVMPSDDEDGQKASAEDDAESVFLIHRSPSIRSSWFGLMPGSKRYLRERRSAYPIHPGRWRRSRPFCIDCRVAGIPTRW